MKILFRGGVMDGRRIEMKEPSSFITIPIGPPNGPYDQVRYRQAETIADCLTVYELDPATTN